MALSAPFNLKGWIEQHRDLLRPPVGNHMLHNGDFMVMVVGGPNQRSDFHVNPGEELFYQIEGDITLRVRDEGDVRDIPIRQGDLFLLPPNVPHSPQRPANTVGLVVERARAADANDHLRWYCRNCGALVYDAGFHLVDLGKQLRPIIEKFSSDAGLRTCMGCGTVQDAPAPKT
jgi:3-hydroxyanthranilate 3,4-dioxygenase